MDRYKIRAHHGMCLAFFEGKGYSSTFTAHMAEMKQLLTGNERVCIVAETDDICSACPNNCGGICTAQEKTAGYDRQVLALCGLTAGTVLEWQRFEELVKQKVLDAGKRKDICGDCQWDSICSKREKM